MIYAPTDQGFLSWNFTNEGLISSKLTYMAYTFR